MDVFSTNMKLVSVKCISKLEQYWLKAQFVIFALLLQLKV